MGLPPDSHWAIACRCGGTATRGAAGFGGVRPVLGALAWPSRAATGTALPAGGAASVPLAPASEKV